MTSSLNGKIKMDVNERVYQRLIKKVLYSQRWEIERHTSDPVWQIWNRVGEHIYNILDHYEQEQITR